MERPVGAVVGSRSPRKSDSRSACGPSRSICGFTLIELLVVVSIIALLVSILLPSLGRARASAKKVVCMSNLHQMGIGVYAYASENNDFVPPMDPWYNDNYSDELDVLFKHGVKRGFGILVPQYISTVELFICPEDKYILNVYEPGKPMEQYAGGKVHTSYLYLGGFTHESNPALVALPGSRRRITDKPLYGPLAVDRMIHSPQSVNVMPLSCEVRNIPLPQDRVFAYYVELLIYLEDQLRHQ